MTASEIRKRFLEYFARQGHRVLRSSSLIPQGDPTLLFTNAGMNQFKDLFLGRERRDYTRAATAQKCMRAGGKHNDLENVGYTNRHLTFFEMLGNFSFGDYFKEPAIVHAWSLLVEQWKLDPGRLHATVFEEDDEAHGIWERRIGLEAGRISRLGAKDNFWAMGDTGPCGPCSEIHFDTARGGCGRPACGPGCECGRYVEIWNLVFMQFERDATGRLQSLPRPSIDTGMGLERITMVLQGTPDVYGTDLLAPILERAAELAGTRYGADASRDVALRVIADHLRSTSFLLADGVTPANDGRGYVLRRIIRRALRFGKRLGFEKPFLHELTRVVGDRLGEAYPELLEAADHIARTVRLEEERFAQALAYSGRAFEDVAARLEAAGEGSIPGDAAFRLYDTYGLPLDTLKDMAEVRSLRVDEAGFQAKLEQVRRSARETWKGEAPRGTGAAWEGLREAGAACRFLGYERLEVEDAAVVAVIQDQREVAVARAGERAGILLDRTPFYPEGGGQVGDRGLLLGTDAYLVVEDCHQPVSGLLVHRVLVKHGEVRAGDRLTARVEASHRRLTASNHSGTHLVHAALRCVLGEHVKQAGSLVRPERLRFDFSHYGRVSPEELRRIEALVNEQVREDHAVETATVSIEEALGRGALAFFGDKYGDRVRVVEMGPFSLELCGGTHVPRTGAIGSFRIVSEAGIASGVRRVEAVTGDGAVLLSLQERAVIDELAGKLNVPVEELVEHVERLRQDLRAARKEASELRLKLASRGGEEPGGGSEFRDIDGTRVAARRVEGLDGAAMRSLADELRKRLRSGVVVLGTVRDGKASILVSVTADLVDRIDAGAVARELAGLVGGTGGGRRDMAQAGGPRSEGLDRALETSFEIVKARLGAAPSTP